MDPGMVSDEEWSEKGVKFEVGVRFDRDDDSGFSTSERCSY